MKACAVDDSYSANDVFAENRCITGSGALYHTHCNPVLLNKTMDVSYDNQFFSASGEVTVACGKHTWNLSQWQAQASADFLADKGSNATTLPDAATVIGWARELLEMP